MYLLVGGSGGPNYGDELMARGWLEAISKRHKVVRLESNIKRNSWAFHDASSSIFSDDIKRVAKKFPKLTFWEQVARGYNFFERGGVKNNNEIDFSFIDKLEVVHLHGGGYVNSNAPVNGFLLGFCAALSKTYKKKVIATGIGLMPISSPEQEKVELFNAVFGGYRGFEVRDYESFRFLKDNLQYSENIYFGLDDSFLLSGSEIASYNENKERRSLYLSFAEYNLAKFSDGYWPDLKKFSEQYDEVVFWECFPWKDRAVYEKLNSHFPGLRLAKAKDIVYKKEEFSKQDFLVTSRFHPHLVSARMGMHGVYYSSGKYYDVKHSSVLAVGSPFNLGSYDEFIALPREPKNLLAMTGELLHRKKLMTYELLVG